jgi:hypothetical protein
MVCKAAQPHGRGYDYDYIQGRWQTSGENARRHVVIEWDKK